MAKASRKQDGRPSMQFYTADWLEEPGLKLCSLAAKGLWIDLLCYMWKMEERGKLRINGVNLGSKEVSTLLGKDEAEVKQTLSELKQYGVSETTDDGCIYNRRMVEDEKQRQSKVEAGRKGGRSKRPSKTEAKGGSPTPTPTPTPSSSSTLTPTPPDKDKEDIIIEVFNHWNTHNKAICPQTGKKWHGHQRLVPAMVDAISQHLGKYKPAELCEAIDNCVEIFTSPTAKWTWAYTLRDFFDRRQKDNRKAFQWIRFHKENFIVEQWTDEYTNAKSEEEIRSEQTRRQARAVEAMDDANATD